MVLCFVQDETEHPEELLQTLEIQNEVAECTCCERERCCTWSKFSILGIGVSCGTHCSQGGGKSGVLNLHRACRAPLGGNTLQPCRLDPFLRGPSRFDQAPEDELELLMQAMRNRNEQLALHVLPRVNFHTLNGTYRVSGFTGTLLDLALGHCLSLILKALAALPLLGLSFCLLVPGW